MIGQVRKRWSTDSVLSLHKLHQKGSCIPLLIRLSPVVVLFFKIDHMNSLVLGGALSFHMPFHHISIGCGLWLLAKKRYPSLGE